MFRNSFTYPARALRALALTGTIGIIASLAAPVYTYAATQGEPPALHAQLSFEGQIAGLKAERSIDVVLAQDGKAVSRFERAVREDGAFTVDMAAMPVGTYQVWVKSPKFLATQVEVEYDGASTPVDLGRLIAGDCNNDNLIGILDYNILRSTLNKGIGDPGYDGRADLNEDNRVNIVDWTLMRGKNGLAGAPRPLTAP